MSNGVVFGPRTAKRLVDMLDEPEAPESESAKRARRASVQSHWVKVDSTKITTTTGSLTAGSGRTVTTVASFMFAVGDKVRIENEVVTVTTGGTGTFVATLASNHASGVSVWLSTSAGHYPGKWYLQNAKTQAMTASGVIWIIAASGATVDTATYHQGRVAGGNNGVAVYVVDVPSGGSGITSLNGLTGATQTFSVGTSGTNFAISSSGTTHTFNLPDASASARGVVTTGTQTFAGTKTFTNSITLSNGTTDIAGIGVFDGTTYKQMTITIGSLFFGSYAQLLLSNDDGSHPPSLVLLGSGSTGACAYSVYPAGGSRLTGAYGTDPIGNVVSGGLVTSVASVTPVADGTYTVGARLTPGGTDGTITTAKGLITAVTQAT